MFLIAVLEYGGASGKMLVSSEQNIKQLLIQGIVQHPPNWKNTTETKPHTASNETKGFFK